MMTISAASHQTTGDLKDGEGTKGDNEHVDAEVPEVAVPFIHQPRLIASIESRQWKKVENKIEDSSVR